MQVFFSSRDKARKAGFGVMCDNGKEAEKGRRYSRNVTTHKTNNNTLVCTSANFERIVPVFVRGKNKL